MTLLSQMSQFSIIRETPGDKSQTFQTSNSNKRQQKLSELKFKIEPIGIQPEDDDDLETCPSRTRSNWPHQITPWWKPADRFEKPPYSYATLIAHAILTSKDGRLTLSDIYKWISETYPYYKLGQKGWQNSIRHNLSLNKKWFIKVDRRPTQAHPGKGGYWTLQMNMEKVFVDNLCQAGGHSRRHPDMNMYSIYPQHYRSPSTPSSSSSNSESSEENQQQHLQLSESQCPNIHITRPEDFETKKSKSNVSAPRIRSIPPPQEKKLAAEMHPQTDGKQLTIRFSALEPTTSSQKRKKASTRPPPKKGKKLQHREPGSSTMEDDDDSAVDVGSFDQISKKRKSSTTTVVLDTISASQSNTLVSHVTPSDVIDSMPYMLLTQSLDYEVIQAQNILEGLTSTVQPEMKTIDLQSSFEKTLHFSNQFDIQDLSNPESKLFMPDLSTYNFDQYVDFSSAAAYLDQPSNVLLDQENNALDIFWPTTSNDCYLDLNLDSYAI